VRIFNCFNVDEYIKKLFEFVNFLKEEKWKKFLWLMALI
jgi:hypothetical protein